MPVSTLNGWTSSGLSPSYATVAHILGDSSSHFHPLNIPQQATTPGAQTPPGAPTTPAPGQYQSTPSAPTGPLPAGQAMTALGQAAIKILGYNPFVPKPKPLTTAAGAVGQVTNPAAPQGSNIPPAVSGQTGFLNLNPQWLQLLGFTAAGSQPGGFG